MTNSARVVAIALVALGSWSLFACRTARPAAQSARNALTANDAAVDALVAQMTLDEKIGQMTQAEQDALHDIGDIRKYFLGSLLSGGNSDPKDGNSVQAWTDMYDRYQAEALKTRLAIPLLYGVDAVHGHNNVLGAVIFPHNIGLGCTRNAALVEAVSRITAEEVRATGINWTFAPCVTVPRDERWGRTYEGYGESPDLARSFGGPAVRGFQGDDLGGALNVLACAKHFAGDGGTTFGTGLQEKPGGPRSPLDRGDTRMDEPTLRAVHLQGYVTAIEAGVGSIMPSYNSWNGVKCSGSRELLDENPQGADGLRGFPHLRLQRARRTARRPQGADRAVDQRRHGHGDGTAAVSSSSSRRSRGWSTRAACRWRASTTP